MTKKTQEPKQDKVTTVDKVTVADEATVKKVTEQVIKEYAGTLEYLAKR